jgi:hypothetical protein
MNAQDTRRELEAIALVTAGSGLASTLEVAYEHYKGSYSNPVVYSPVVLSTALTGAASCQPRALRIQV